MGICEFGILGSGNRRVREFRYLEFWESLNLRICDFENWKFVDSVNLGFRNIGIRKEIGNLGTKKKILKLVVWDIWNTGIRERIL